MQASKCPAASFEKDICNQGYPYKRCRTCGVSSTNICNLTQSGVVSEAASRLYHGKSYEEVAAEVAPKIRKLVDIEVAKRIDENGQPVSRWHSTMLTIYILVSVPSIIYAGSELIHYLSEKLGG